MKIINLREGTSRYKEMPYPVMSNMPEALPYLEKMYKALSTVFPEMTLELVGTGTSGASIGTWLQQRSNYKYGYSHIEERFSKSHRHGSFGNLNGNLVIVDDKVATGATLCHVIKSLPKYSIVQAIAVSWSYFTKEGSALDSIKKTAVENNVTIKNLIVL